MPYISLIGSRRSTIMFEKKNLDIMYAVAPNIMDFDTFSLP